MLAVVWILALVALVVWSLVSWGLYRLLTLDPQWVGELAPLIERIPYGEQIDRWFPGWQDMLRAAIDLTQVLLGSVGQIAPWAVGVVWAVGAALLAAGTALAVALVLWWRRSRYSTSRMSPSNTTSS